MVVTLQSMWREELREKIGVSPAISEYAITAPSTAVAAATAAPMIAASGQPPPKDAPAAADMKNFSAEGLQ